MENYLEYKRKLIECTQWLSDNGFFGTLRGTGGNLSMRVEGQDLFVVTPSSLPYDQLTPDDMCVLDFEQKPVQGNRKPSIEAAFHLEVYKRRPDTNAVIHTHQIYGSTFAALNRPIPPLFDEVIMSLGTEIAVIPYALSGSPDLVRNVGNKLDNMCNAYLIQNHGVLCLGSTLEKAWVNVELLEKTARIYLGALSTGAEPTHLPDEIVELIKELRKSEFNKGE